MPTKATGWPMGVKTGRNQDGEALVYRCFEIIDAARLTALGAPAFGLRR